MKLIQRHPDCGYLDTWLWLPKKYVSEHQLKSMLLYEGRNKEAIHGWREEVHHIRVPRNYYTPGTLSTLPYKVYDTRFTDFPKVKFHSRVKLDLKEPDKDYQQAGCNALLGTHDGILCLRCGAGKTVVALHAAAQIGQPILIIVNEKGLVHQWIEEIHQHLGIPKKDIGRIGGKGSPFEWERPVSVGIVNTIAQRAVDGRIPPEMVRHFGVIVPDEAHLMAAPFFNQAIPPFHGRRWGLTATPNREDGFDSLLRSTVGDVVYTYLDPSLRPKVFFKRLDTTLAFNNPKVFKETHDKTGEFHFLMTYGYLARKKPDRVAAIAKDVREALDMGRQCLVLTHSRDMCDALEQHFPQGGVCHGGITDGVERMRRIRDCNPVIAIMQIGKQALDKPSLDTLFITEPFKKSGMLQQTMGRVLRLFQGKKKPVVIIYEDSHIGPLKGMCAAIKKAFRKWPSHKGGRIEFKYL